jgi:hypothetical protein
MVSGLPDGLFSNQKSQFWVNFGVSCNGRCWYILWPFDQFYGHLVYIMAIWHIFPRFGIFYHVLVFCTQKNLAILHGLGRGIFSASR